MDRRTAHALTLRLSAALQQQPSSSTETVQANPHAGGDAGYVSRVHRSDGSHVDVIGSDRSGYQLIDRTTGWQPFDLLVAELLASEPTPDAEPTVEVPSLVDRMTEVASLMRRAADELCAVRDQLMIEGTGRVSG